MKKIIALLCLSIAILVAIPLNVSAAELMTVQYTVNGSYTISIPDYIEAETEGSFVEISNVLIPYDHKLTVTAEFDGLLRLKDATHITLPYSLLAEEKECRNGDIILWQTAGNLKKTSSVKLSAQVTESPLYAGLYTSTVMFNIGIDEVIETNYSSKDIENNEHLFGIGKTKPEYVVAEFNDNYTSVVITKNGENSDGIMKDFAGNNYSPMSNKSETLTNAEIKEGITYIGKYSFNYCDSLQRVGIADSITNIGSNAFINCASLNNVILPDNLTTIGTDVFRNCTSLEHITIPNTVTSIGNSVFYDCSNLKSVELSQNITSIPSYMFLRCKNLKEIEIPNNVTKIAWGAFAECESLGNFIIPDSVTSIEMIAFRGCNSLTIMTIPENVQNLGNSIFLECENLKSATLPDGLTEIPSGMFKSCKSLSDITIPESVTSIGSGAFNSCHSLKDIFIPTNVASIGDGAFNLTKSLERFEVADDNQYFCEKDGVLYSKDMSTLRQIPLAINMQSFTIPDSVATLAYYCIGDCSSFRNLKNLYVKDTVTEIADSILFTSTTMNLKLHVQSGSAMESHCISKKIKYDNNMV